ncbi:caspase family protein [Chitinophaga sp.]|uniref:caspase family protein n=1 Tax=Chitinophaga sp. TaxID=1869181 RepID=UPI0031CF2B04
MENECKGPGVDTTLNPKDTIRPEYQEGTTYIIAIGIDEYDGKLFRPLKSCKNDCEAFIAVMQNAYKNVEVYNNGRIYNEQATKEKIKDALILFKKSGFNKFSNNLIIFFSGHGDRHIIEEANAEYNCIVPYPGTTDMESQLSFHELKPTLQSIKTRHLLLVLDCCYAGAAFQDLMGTEQMNNEANRSIMEIGMERSRFAITACRSYQVAEAGKENECSPFTKELVKKLMENKEPRIYFQDIAEQVVQTFGNDLTRKQRAQSGLLMITNHNQGRFQLWANEAVFHTGRMKELFASELRRFDYEKQRKQWGVIGTDKWPYFTLMSDIRDAGLFHLVKMIKQRVPVLEQAQISRLSLQMLDVDPENALLGIFNHTLRSRSQFSSLQEVHQHIQSVLLQTSIVVEVHIEDTTSASSAAQVIRQKIIEKLAAFVDKINSQESAHAFYIIIIDFDNTDYSAIINKEAVGNVPSAIIEKVEAMKKTAFKSWLSELIIDLKNKDDKVSIGILEKRIGEKLDDIFIDTEELHPGTIIERICHEIHCPDLANELLN